MTEEKNDRRDPRVAITSTESPRSAERSTRAAGPSWSSRWWPVAVAALVAAPALSGLGLGAATATDDTGDDEDIVTHNGRTDDGGDAGDGTSDIVTHNGRVGEASSGDDEDIVTHNGRVLPSSEAVLLVLAGWGMCPDTGPCDGDMNGDALVDDADLDWALGG